MGDSDNRVFALKGLLDTARRPQREAEARSPTGAVPGDIEAQPASASAAVARPTMSETDDQAHGGFLKDGTSLKQRRRGQFVQGPLSHPSGGQACQPRLAR